jgi:hypothetical protein
VHPPREFPLRHDELLSKQRIFGNEANAVAHDVSGQPYHEPKDIDHAVRRTLPSGRMAFVARTGSSERAGIHHHLGSHASV